MPGPILIALTGASGTIYGVRAVQRLVSLGVACDVIVSPSARKVLAIEHGLSADPQAWCAPAGAASLRVWDHGDITAPAASGSSAPAAMVVIPCSMGTVGRLRAGLSSNLIERAADVMLKERRPLVLVPRESPLSTLHLRHLAELSELGVRIVPAMPAFYAGAETIEDLLAFVVDRALDAAQVPDAIRQRWRAGDRADDDS